ncbi:hypothetical protein EJ08DRAFT_650268 [Tothia fuscella]|uniref:Uncharacterized protein n=1 Tax=Tothia fuscella TaxID=1048955 RepID=A0A9P4TY78_9PEZI|nr:hypothetical protein EJ08DRAFT_650268 [Tothia fuscella]
MHYYHHHHSSEIPYLHVFSASPSHSAISQSIPPLGYCNLKTSQPVSALSHYPPHVDIAPPL